MSYKNEKGFADWSDEWDSEAGSNSLKASGTYDADSDYAAQFGELTVDGESRVDDGDEWRELAFDEPPKNAKEYEELVQQWSNNGFDVRAIDMDGDFVHSNIAVRIAGDGGGADEGPSTWNEHVEAGTLSPHLMEAIERTNNYRERAWSGQAAQDVYGKSRTLAADNNLGIPVGDLKTGEPNANQALRAADEATGRYFNQDQFQIDFGGRNPVGQNIVDRMAAR